MRTAEERAKKLAKLLCISGEDPELVNSYNYDIKCIVEALKEQDKLTRHAIAEAITVEPDLITSDGAYYNVLSKDRVHNIAMNTSAV